MPPDDNNGGELIEALTDVYTAGQRGKIFGVVNWRSDVQPDKIRRQTQNGASLYKSYSRLLSEACPPSVQERRLQRVLKKLCAAAAAVRDLSKTDLDYLNAAGQDLARDEKSLPDVEPNEVAMPQMPGQTEPDYVSIWDAVRQIDASLERIDWLIRCVEQAIERTGWEKLPHGGPVADDALHTAIRMLDKIYFENAADPRTPGTDTGDDSEDSRTWRKSELLNFLEAALHPLGVGNSREAICGHWRRATTPND